MRDPPGEKKRGLRHVAGIKAACPEEIAGVIERHQRHHEAAQDVDGLYPPTA